MFRRLNAKAVERDMHVIESKAQDQEVCEKLNTLFIFYKNVIFFLKPSKEIEIATSEITTTFLIFECFDALLKKTRLG